MAIRTRGISIIIYLQGNAITPHRIEIIQSSLEEATATLKQIAATKEDFLYIDSENSGHPLIVNRSCILYAGIE